jgi:hypothetical protein
MLAVASCVERRQLEWQGCIVTYMVAVLGAFPRLLVSHRQLASSGKSSVLSLASLPLVVS